MMSPDQIRYERVTAQGVTVLLRVTGENERFLTGIEVRSDGDEVRPRGADERLRLIEKSQITRRTSLRMNRLYGQLEEAG
jgi:hypothetical protein